MMTPPPSHRRTDARHFARLSPGNDPACARPQICPWSHRKSCGATRDPLVHTSTHAQASSQGNRIADL
jgi:hypothetical protein